MTNFLMGALLGLSLKRIFKGLIAAYEYVAGKFR